MGDYGVLCRYQQRRQSDRDNHRRHGQPVHLLLTVDAAGCRAQHRADDDELFTQHAMCWRSAPFGWVAR